MVKKITALLPMKGHSERVPGKNVRPLGGRPLFLHILESLLDSKQIGQIYIDTDSTTIAKLAKPYSRVTIIDRPQKLRGDMVPMTDILKHDLSLIEGDRFLQTHATNPFLKTKTIDRAITALRTSQEKDSLLSVTPRKNRYFDLEGKPINHNPRELLRTQDLKPLYEENSNLYIFPRLCLLKENRRYSDKAIFFEMDPLEALDIDDESDFLVAENLYSTREKPDGE